MLVDLGFDAVRSMARLAPALSVSRSERFDIAILDVNLGGELSFPVASVLSERGIPYIFSTGYGPSVLPPEFASRPVLSKPFTDEQLASTIKAALSENAARSRAGERI
jgi:DNA-binding response OmpR family regulator